MKAWIDGSIINGEDARVPVLDHGYLYGDGVFEGIRVAKGRIFRLVDHISRLQLSARAIGLTLPWSGEEISEIVKATAAAFGQDEAYVRLIVSRGEGALGVDPASCPNPRLICLVGDIALYSDAQRKRGLTMITSSLRRPAFDMLDPRVKSLNYLNNVLAKAEAKRQGADEALILNQAGRVAEASVANIFIVNRDGYVATPPTSEGALAGITRQTTIEIARSLTLTIEEAALTRLDLLAANEIFLTGSGAGVVNIGSLDGHTIGCESDRPITTKIAAMMEERRTSLGTPF